MVIAQSDSELSSTLFERALFVFDAFACPIASLLFYFFYFFFIECQLFVCESVLFLVFFTVGVVVFLAPVCITFDNISARAAT